MTSGIWSTGSVIDHVTKLIGGALPAAISGTNMTSIIDQELNFIEQYSTVTIDSSAIPEMYQPPLCDLVLSKLMLSSEMTQGGIDNVSLGELSVSQAGGGGAELAIQLRQDAILRLQELQRKVRFKRVLGV